MELEERDPRGWVVKALREAGNALVRELAGMDEETVRKRPAEGELSLIEIAAHLRDSEELAASQITCLVHTPGRKLPVRDLDLLVLERDYRSLDPGEVLANLHRTRRENTYLLWGLDEDEWQRPAKHPFREGVTLEVIARELAQHDLEHLWQIRRLKHELGAAEGRVQGGWDDW